MAAVGGRIRAQVHFPKIAKCPKANGPTTRKEIANAAGIAEILCSPLLRPRRLGAASMPCPFLGPPWRARPGAPSGRSQDAVPWASGRGHGAGTATAVRGECPAGGPRDRGRYPEAATGHWAHGISPCRRILLTGSRENAAESAHGFLPVHGDLVWTQQDPAGRRISPCRRRDRSLALAAMA